MITLTQRVLHVANVMLLFTYLWTEALVLLHVRLVTVPCVITLTHQCPCVTNVIHLYSCLKIDLLARHAIH